MISEQKPHLSKDLLSSVAMLQTSPVFFNTTECDDSFLSILVEDWPRILSYEQVLSIATKLACINDCAEQGAVLIEKY